MWGTCKIVNFLAIVFNSCDWSKSLNTKKHPFKVECKSFYCINGLTVHYKLI